MVQFSTKTSLPPIPIYVCYLSMVWSEKWVGHTWTPACFPEFCCPGSWCPGYGSLTLSYTFVEIFTKMLFLKKLNFSNMSISVVSNQTECTLSWIIDMYPSKALSSFCFMTNLSSSLNFSLFMRFVLQIKTNKDKSTETVSPLLFTPPYRGQCNAENQKMSAKGSNFTEDDRALPPSLFVYNLKQVANLIAC